MRPTRDTSQLRNAKTPQPREAVSSTFSSGPSKGPEPPATSSDGQSPSALNAMPSDDFGELIAAAQAGKTDALERLLAGARPRLLALAMRVLGDVDEAEDAVQDAMIKVWRHLDRFEGRAAFTTWLHRIAVNAALDRRRRRSAGRDAHQPRRRRRSPARRQRSADRHRDAGADLRPRRDRRRRSRRDGAPVERARRGAAPVRSGGRVICDDRDRDRLPAGHGDVAALPCPPQPGPRADLARDR